MGLLTTVLIMVVTAGAAINVALGDQIRYVIQIGGITGGGTILVLLPLLTEHRDHLRRRFGIASVVASAVLGAWAMGIALTGDIEHSARASQ